MKFRELSPIALFVYNRPDHTRQTIEALLNNPEAAKSHLFIFSDAPKTLEDVAGVEEVRQYVKGIEGFFEINIIQRDRNWGLANSIIDGVTQLCKKFGRVIVLEDDLLTSHCFLAYMNEALECFENDSSIAAVSGYMFPINNEFGNRIFFRKTPLSWGWATWHDSWLNFNSDGKTLLNRLKEQNKLLGFDYSGPQPFSTMLKKQVSGKNDSWFIRWCASLFLAGKLTVMPTKSLVKNIGIDGTGTHCAEWRFNPYEVELADEPILMKPLDSMESIKIERRLLKYFIGIRFLRYVNFIYRLIMR